MIVPSAVLRRTLLPSLAAAALALAAAPVDAQTVARPGEDVRLRAADGSVARGRLLSADADSVVVTDGDGARRAWSVVELRAVEVRRGRSRDASGVRGMLIGGAAGAVLGAISLHASAESSCARGCQMPAALVGGMVGGALGGATGGVIGVAFPGRRWRTAVLPAEAPRARLEVAPAADGAVRVGVSVRFD